MEMGPEAGPVLVTPGFDSGRRKGRWLLLATTDVHWEAGGLSCISVEPEIGVTH